MQPKKIIFLDIDGVVLTARSELAGHYEPDQVLLAGLRKAAKQGVEFVIISDWRLGKKESAQTGLRNILGSLMDHLHEDWATPDHKGHTKRGVEVAHWLSLHPEVTDYVILDDKDRFLPEQRPHLIKSNTREGLSARQLKRLEEWVKVPTQKIDGLEMKRPTREIPESAIPERGKTR